MFKEAVSFSLFLISWCVWYCIGTQEVYAGDITWSRATEYKILGSACAAIFTVLLIIAATAVLDIRRGRKSK